MASHAGHGDLEGDGEAAADALAVAAPLDDGDALADELAADDALADVLAADDALPDALGDALLLAVVVALAVGDSVQ